MEIIRLAAKGDGVTRQGVHVRGALPGDTADESGAILTRGSHHQPPPCRHFGTCGGCQLQHADDDALTTFVRERVVNAALGQGLDAREELPTHLSPIGARRRATVHAVFNRNNVSIGFRETGSHRIVDCQECFILHRQIADLIGPLRDLLGKHPSKAAIDIQMALCDQGIDVGLTNFPLAGLAGIEALSDFAGEHALSRLTVDQGYGAETQWEPDPVTINLSGVAVPFPAGAFLQATEDAEALMIDDARKFLGEARLIADLFSGLGTFAFALRKGRKVLAAEAEQAAHLACKSAAGRAQTNVFPIHRDLFRNPVTAAELSKFDAVLLDPPRAGAKAQIGEIARSHCNRVVYVSCNPSSWARDAATLAGAGFKLTKLRPIGQFRWSTHVELISLLERAS